MITFCLMRYRKTTMILKILFFLKTRLDEFMKTYTLNENKYEQFWDVCKYIFTLSHEQSSVERGFNINKDALKQNMDTSTIAALRVVHQMK